MHEPNAEVRKHRALCASLANASRALSRDATFTGNRARCAMREHLCDRPFAHAFETKDI
jgi:hypothetical protein